MAEILGLVSAIISIAATGFKISHTISAIADDFGSVGPQLKAIAANTQAVAWILDELKVRLLNAKFLAKDAVEVVQKIVAQCQVEIDDINECVAPITRDGKEFSSIQRLKWLLAKPKLSTKTAALDSLKLTLTMFICTIRFTDGHAFKESMHDEIESQVSQSEQVRTTFLHAESEDQKAEMAYAASHTGPRLENSGKEGITTASIENNGDRSEETTVQIYQASPSDYEVARTISNDQFLKIADHIRLQGLVSTFALAVVNRTQNMPAPTDNGASPESGTRARNSGPPSDATNNWRVFGSDGIDSPGYQGTGPGTFDETGYARAPSPGYYAYRQPGPSGYQFGTQQTFHRPPMPPPSQPQPGDYYAYTQPGISGYQFGAHQGYYSPPMQPPPPPQEPEPQGADPEIQALRKQLDELRAEKTQQMEKAERAKEESKIRQEAEDAFRRHMEDMKNAQEQASMAVEKAKAEAERAARDRIEAERKAEIERQKLHEAAMKRVEHEAREKIEMERLEFEKRKQEQAEATAKAEAEIRAKIRNEKKKRGLMKYFAPAV